MIGDIICIVLSNSIALIEREREREIFFMISSIWSGNDAIVKYRDVAYETLTFRALGSSNDYVCVLFHLLVIKHVLLGHTITRLSFGM